MQHSIADSLDRKAKPLHREITIDAALSEGHTKTAVVSFSVSFLTIVGLFLVKYWNIEPLAILQYDNARKLILNIFAHFVLRFVLGFFIKKNEWMHQNFVQLPCFILLNVCFVQYFDVFCKRVPCIFRFEEQVC